ncbi:hypothetical protein [Dyadobacter diqingensis]|uniref:hypothetical protein n=1 Tax=Dyadobacter diqingensis TaxID=2938121 RepID=UPI0020C1AE11|nr:hypothetical protein [Dyadobacter diqingensis]
MIILGPISKEQLISFAVICLGALIRFIILQRRFNRRSPTGRQLFKSYLHGLLISLIERLFLLASAVMILGGFVYFLFAG